MSADFTMTSAYPTPTASPATDSTRQIGTDPILPLLLRFSVPSIVGMLVQAFYNIVDRMFIGHGIGSHGLAGVTLSFPLMMIMVSFSILIGVGANTLFSIRMGEGRRKEAEQILGNAFGLLFFVPLVASLIALTQLDPLLRLVGASNDLLPHARTYARIILAGSALSTTSHGLAHFVRSDGHPIVAMASMIIGALTNVALDALFIFGFGWGMAGAAWATVISQGLAFAWCLGYFLSPRANTRLQRRNLRLDYPKIVWPMLGIGFAPFAMTMANSLLNVILNRGLGEYGGDDAIAIMGILSAFMSIIFMPVFGLTQGAQPLIGYNFGARQYDRVLQLFWSTAIATTVVMILGWSISQLFPRQILRLFLAADSELVPLGVHALRVFTLAFPIIGFPITGGHLFQAIGKPIPAALLALSRQIIFFIPFILIFPKFWGLKGIFYAAPASDTLTCLIAIFVVSHQLRLLRRRITSSPPPPTTP
ncbi:MAG: MATE family efflux transporter [Kiritimatiellae bacterium]|nr:MATE family efflux transporter [Kiritimatiellia bacterium]